jgi:hypothetical protein
MIFKYRDVDSYAGFSNYFRYKLLLERGGWWVDTDMVCLRPFDFEDDYVFASEIINWGAEVITSGVIKAPPGSPLMEFAWETCLLKDPQEIQWGETEPRLMQEAVARFHLEDFQNRTRFLSGDSSAMAVRVGSRYEPRPVRRRIRDSSLERAMETRPGQNSVYPASSIYEQLKRRYQLRAEPR